MRSNADEQKLAICYYIPLVGDAQETFDRQFVGGATGYYARGNVYIVSKNLHGRRRTHPDSRGTP